MPRTILIQLKEEHNQAFQALYKKYFKVVRRFIHRNNGSTKDAEDVFQDTMFILLEKLRRDDFRLTASIQTYIVAIAKNLWLKRLRTLRQTIAFSEQHESLFFEEIDNTIYQEKSYRNRLQHYMRQITAHCKGLIHAIFFKHQSIEQIQKKYGYSSKHNAQNQKHKCIEQIRRLKAAEERKHSELF